MTFHTLGCFLFETRKIRRTTKYKVDTLKSKHNYILYIANDGKTANNHMFRPLERPSSGCTFIETQLYNI